MGITEHGIVWEPRAAEKAWLSMLTDVAIPRRKAVLLGERYCTAVASRMSTKTGSSRFSTSCQAEPYNKRDYGLFANHSPAARDYHSMLTPVL